MISQGCLPSVCALASRPSPLSLLLNSSLNVVFLSSFLPRPTPSLAPRRRHRNHDGSSRRVLDRCFESPKDLTSLPVRENSITVASWTLDSRSIPSRGRPNDPSSTIQTTHSRYPSRRSHSPSLATLLQPLNPSCPFMSPSLPTHTLRHVATRFYRRLHSNMCAEAAMAYMGERECLQDRARARGMVDGELQVRTATAALSILGNLQCGATREPSMCWIQQNVSSGWRTSSHRVAPQQYHEDQEGR
jgi:hypothetical protein